jgi:hypothetical protein
MLLCVRKAEESMSMEEQSERVASTGSRIAPDTADGLMNEHAAAAFLGYTIRALQNWRQRGCGPQYVKVSAKSVRYQRRDLQAWIDARLCSGDAPQRSGQSRR